MQALKIAGIGFMMYVSYLLFNASGKLAKLSNYNATFWQGAIMQWLNPKAWMASMAAVSAFELNVFEHLLVFCLIYLLVCFLCILCWAGAGNFLQHWFTHGNRLNAFNKTMALILAMVALVILVM